MNEASGPTPIGVASAKSRAGGAGSGSGEGARALEVNARDPGLDVAVAEGVPAHVRDSVEVRASWDEPRVPRLGPARICVWIVLALAIARYHWDTPPPVALQPSMIGGDCMLAAVGSAPPCPCDALPAALRRVLGLPLDLNRASAEDLQLLPGIGPRRAEQIVASRAKRGSFASISELRHIHGIGPKTLAQLELALFVGTSDPACSRPVEVLHSASR